MRGRVTRTLPVAECIAGQSPPPSWGRKNPAHTRIVACHGPVCNGSSPKLSKYALPRPGIIPTSLFPRGLTMYAIIRAGGKQAKVKTGDVIEIERVKDSSDSMTFTPLLVVAEDGTTVSDRSILSDSKVVAEVLGETQGDKIDIFKYKNKTGYRRHMGHRQKYTQIRVTSIDVPKAAKATKATKATKTTKATKKSASQPTQEIEEPREETGED
jgi:large subunit ribosomal protein L21